MAEQLTEAQQAWLDFLNSPGVYPDGVDAIAEPETDEDGNAFVIFQDGVKKVKMTLFGDPPDRYESQILNPDEVGV